MQFPRAATLPATATSLPRPLDHRSGRLPDPTSASRRSRTTSNRVWLHAAWAAVLQLDHRTPKAAGARGHGAVEPLSGRAVPRIGRGEIADFTMATGDPRAVAPTISTGTGNAERRQWHRRRCITSQQCGHHADLQLRSTGAITTPTAETLHSRPQYSVPSSSPAPITG